MFSFQESRLDFLTKEREDKVRTRQETVNKVRSEILRLEELKKNGAISEGRRFHNVCSSSSHSLIAICNWLYIEEKQEMKKLGTIIVTKSAELKRLVKPSGEEKTIKSQLDGF